MTTKKKISRAHPRRRGSVLILIIVSLAMIMLMGFMYLQVAKSDREATRASGSYLTSVRDAVIQKIQNTLQDDLVNTATGKFFDPAAYIEPYDYPSNAATWTGVTTDTGRFDDMWLATTVPDMSLGVNGKWGKVSVLADNSATPQYKLLTNWTGTGFSAAPGEVDVDAGGTATRDVGTAGTGVPVLDTPTANYVDADGDGIVDSYWQWATLKQVNNMTYTMAVRIIDNSSLININTAMGLTTDGTSTSAAQADRPRGWMPTDIDLTRLIRSSYTFTAPATSTSPQPAGSGWSSGNLQPSNFWDLLVARNDAYTGAFGGSLTIPQLGLVSPGWAAANWDATTPYTRGGAWLQRARKWKSGSLYIYDPTIDELELRNRGGINTVTDVTSENQMLNLLRKDHTSEVKYSDVPNYTNGAVWFQGGDDTGVPAIKDRVFPDVRKMLTTISGTDVMAYNYEQAGFPNTNRRLKYDLTHQDGGPTNNNTARVANLTTLLEAILETGAGGVAPPAVPNPINDTRYLGYDTTTLTQVATEYAVAIQDYTDPDDVPTKPATPLAGVDYYGLETIPFLEEAYVEVALNGSDKWDGTGGSYSPNVSPPTVLGDNKSDTWDYVPNSEAFAVEIGNPFDHDLVINGNIRLLIGIKHSDLAQYTLPNTTIPARQSWIFYVNPTAFPISANENGCTGNVETDLFSTVTDKTALTLDVSSPAVLTLTGGGASARLIVKLQVQDSTGTWVTYDRLYHASFAPLPTTVTSNAGNNQLQGTTVDTPIHAQLSLVRDAQNIRYISNYGCDINSGGRVLAQYPGYYGSALTPPGPGPAPAYDGLAHPFNALGQTNKGVTGDTTLDSVQLAHPNRPIMNVAELGWIWMLGFHHDPIVYPSAPVVPPALNDDDDPGDLPSVLGSLYTTYLTDHAVARRFLDVSPTAKVPTNLAAGVPSLPHAAMLLDQFTVLSPANDNLNNTTGVAGDPSVPAGPPAWPGQNEQKIEQFVPGTININTVPLHIATLAAPLPESIDDIQTAMETITRYRNVQQWNNGTTYKYGDRVWAVSGTDINAYMSLANVNLNHDPTVAANATFWLQTAHQDTGTPANSWGRVAGGLASIGELMFLNPVGTNTPPTYAIENTGPHPENLQRYGYDTADNSGSAALLYPLPEEQPALTPQTVTDDAVQKMARYQFLGQVFTTRSDIFTAYILINGYRNGSYTAPVESGRWIVVFDRSNVTKATDAPQVLAVYKVQ